MLRSLFSGVSGMKNHQLKMDVIADNISNVNTIAFKASRVVFKDFFSQTLRSSAQPLNSFEEGAGAIAGTGGTNAMQIGLGSNISTVDIMFSGATSGTRTELNTDFMISGDGFFVVRAATNVTLASPSDDINLGVGAPEYYTRAGNFYLDQNGFLMTGDGMYVQMFMAESVEEPPDPEARSAQDLMCVNFRVGVDEAKDIAFADTDVDTENIIDYERVIVESNGQIKGYFGSMSFYIGTIAVMTFINPNGLEKAGGNLYVSNANTGYVPDPEFNQYKTPGERGAGTVTQGVVEMSNVDLAREFSEMIITQRGFQANSRIITVSDTILEELVNLKR